MSDTEHSSEYAGWATVAAQALGDMDAAPVPEIAMKARAKAEVAAQLASAAATMHLAAIIDWKLSTEG